MVESFALTYFRGCKLSRQNYVSHGLTFAKVYQKNLAGKDFRERPIQIFSANSNFRLGSQLYSNMRSSK